jgi:hypothetical protein
MLAKRLLTHPLTEEMVKHGQYDAVRWMIEREETLPAVQSVRICIRNGYKIEDFGMWLDMVNNLMRFGKDVRSAKYVCPEDLQAAHDKWMRKAQEDDRRKRREAALRTIAREEEKYAKRMGKYIMKVIEGGGIRIHVLRSVMEFYEEGEAMHHCVYTNGYYKKENCIILGARNEKGERLETLEVSAKTWKVLQSRGVCNKQTERHDDIVRLMEINMDVLRKARRARNERGSKREKAAAG